MKSNKQLVTKLKINILDIGSTTDDTFYRGRTIMSGNIISYEYDEKSDPTLVKSFEVELWKLIKNNMVKNGWQTNKDGSIECVMKKFNGKNYSIREYSGEYNNNSFSVSLHK